MKKGFKKQAQITGKLLFATGFACSLCSILLVGCTHDTGAVKNYLEAIQAPATDLTGTNYIYQFKKPKIALESAHIATRVPVALVEPANVQIIVPTKVSDTKPTAAFNTTVEFVPKPKVRDDQAILLTQSTHS